MSDDSNKVAESSKRIDELGKKSGQVLLFLSFAMVSVATLKTIHPGSAAALNDAALNDALNWWKWALVPILVGVLPMKEICWENECWYRLMACTRFG